MSLFNNQSLLSITLDCGTNVMTADITMIAYVRPDQTQGMWVGTPVGNTIVYSFANGDINQSGNWQFQAYVEIGGRKTYGDIITKTFLEPLIIPLIP
jgi:hypothetical protein